MYSDKEEFLPDAHNKFIYKIQNRNSFKITWALL